MSSAAAEALRAGDRRALARAITLIESTRPEDEEAAEALLGALSSAGRASRRAGVTGAPGVGKSRFIEAFGFHALTRGHRVAVLAVDPSSDLSGGSILGDKTRMERLAREEGAFVRPSPSGGEKGGVARRTRDAIALVEAAGYDVVIVETVGVGQSETAVAGMTDIFLLLLAPGGGDDLQGIKRGVMERADLVLVNKADGVLADAARRMVADHRAALGLMRPREPWWRPRVETCSALTGDGIARCWDAVDAYMTALGPERSREKRRRQARAALWDEAVDLATRRLAAEPWRGALRRRLEADIEAGRLSPRAAARRLLGPGNRAGETAPPRGD